ncbi:MAG: hypothetical protein DRH30_00905 [Deltaproteobacteria bacterium]|nr:MAG: hypothetical protein DRH30_00905 [Deltaproteobacteria bacterium]
MNPLQQIEQLDYLTRSAVWPGVGGKAVMDSMISALTPQELVGEASSHFVVWAPSTDTGDAEQPDMIDQRYSAWLACVVYGDRKGEHPVIGGTMGPDGVLASDGRGLLEVQAPFLEAVAKLTGANGIRATCAYKSGIAPAMIDRTNWVFRQYTFLCMASSKAYYHPVRRLSKSGSTLTWTLPPDRFDRFRIVLRVADGSTTPPASPTDGRGVALASDLATTVDDPAASPVAYSAFAAYDGRQDGAPAVERAYSALEAGSTLAIP